MIQKARTCYVQHFLYRYLGRYWGMATQPDGEKPQAEEGGGRGWTERYIA